MNHSYEEAVKELSIFLGKHVTADNYWKMEQVLLTVLQGTEASGDDYENGYSDGYEEGRSFGIQETEDEAEESYKAGYQDGLQSVDDSFQNGYDQGVADERDSWSCK